MKFIILALCVFIALINFANAREMYRCIDRNGNNIITDTPQNDMKCDSKGEEIKSMTIQNHKFHPGITNKNDQLIEAATKGNLPDVKNALAEGADVNYQENYYHSTALMNASGQGYLAIVELLLKNGANVNVKGNVGMTALMMASSMGHAEVVKILLDHGADVTAKFDHTGTAMTALMIASQKGHKDIVEILKRAGANE